MIVPGLRVLRDEVDRRVEHLRLQKEDWPCARGCDTCCRHLAESPRLTRPEWDELEAALRALPEERRDEVGARIRELEAAQRPVVCPFLERERGECLVYLARPLACRTHGYYVGREGGRWCDDIEAKVSSEDTSTLMFGNHDAFEHQTTRNLGESRALHEWFVDGRTDP